MRQRVQHTQCIRLGLIDALSVSGCGHTMSTRTHGENLSDCKSVGKLQPGETSRGRTTNLHRGLARTNLVHELAKRSENGCGCDTAPDVVRSHCPTLSIQSLLDRPSGCSQVMITMSGVVAANHGGS